MSITENIAGETEGTRPDAAETAQRRSHGETRRVARGLGWFSIGLGLTELIAPRAVARLVGTRSRSALLRGYGLREIASGAGILSNPQPAGWLWARAAGDALDLASLGVAAGSRRSDRGKAAVGLAAVAGVTALDIWCARQLTAATENEPGPQVQAEAGVIVNCSPEECYQFWRDLENRPRFLSHVDTVQITGDRTSHWIATLPDGSRMEWDAEVVEDVPNQLIRWRTITDARLRHSGTVEFVPAPGNRGTIVRVRMDFEKAAAPLRVKAALGIGKAPARILDKQLRRFKQLMETGEVIQTEGQPVGRRSSVTWLDKIAR